MDSQGFATAIREGREKARVSQWQLIKTAPKDGTHILLWGLDGTWFAGEKRAFEGWYNKKSKMWDSHSGRFVSATHWMSLPDHPPHG